MSRDESLIQHLLIERARIGDQEAFSELVRQHRSRMLKWANQVVSNPAKAEDIVQEALLLTLKRMDRLADPDKFLPWLRTIVRNQALMSMRGRKNKQELLVGARLSESDEEVEWAGEPMDDPQVMAVGREAMEAIEKLLGRLGERERAVVEAHILGGVSIREVSDRLRVNSGAVYTALSRARTKLNEARYEEEMDRYLAARRRKMSPRHVHLSHVRYYEYASAHNTMAATILLAITATGTKQVSLTDVMGATGHAFRIQVTPDLGLSGAYAYDWADAANIGLQNLGYSRAVFGGAGTILHRPDEWMDAMDTIFGSLEQGIPVIAWHVSNAEFGLITGYDDEDRCWTVMDTSASAKRLPYTKLGRVRKDSEWFAFVPLSRHPVSCEERLKSIFEKAIHHIQGDSAPSKFPGSACGREAYRIWIDAFGSRSVTSPLIAAYHAAVVAEARSHAVRFLRNLSEFGNAAGRFSEAIPAIAYAGQLYERIHSAWARISQLFPLPYGADPTAPGPAERTARLLEQALAAELEVAEVLEEVVYRLK